MITMDIKSTEPKHAYIMHVQGDTAVSQPYKTGVLSMKGRKDKSIKEKSL